MSQSIILLRKKKFFQLISILFLSLWILSCADINAQNTDKGIIKGCLVNEQREAVPYATILLRNPQDSSLYKGELSNELGEYLFNNVKSGVYFIEINALGFEKMYKTEIRITETNFEVNADTLRLRPSANLSEITITAENPFIEKRTDKVVVNVENSIVSVGSNVLEVIKKIPGVQVSEDGQVNLNGKAGVTIYINGKATFLSSKDIVLLLKGMPSSNIQKIEIMSKPSSKYDAAGGAGVINIITKKNHKEGVSAGIIIGYGQGRYEKGNAGFNLSAKDKWYNLYANYACAYDKDFNSAQMKTNFLKQSIADTVFRTNDYFIGSELIHRPGLDADFYLSSKTTLSLFGMGSIGSADVSSHNSYTDVFDSNNNKIYSYDFKNNSNLNFYNYSAGLQLNHQIDSNGRKILVNADYADYVNTQFQDLTTILKNANNGFIDQSILLGDQKRKLNIYALKADYFHPLKDEATLELGLKSSYVHANNNNKFFTKEADILILDSTKLNHFIYSENINAAYINLNKKYKKASVQLGLRAEHTFANGEQLTTGEKIPRNYIMLFPSAFFDYQVNDNHKWSVNASRRIDRPAYEQMNPARFLIDAINYTQGNIYLLPQLSYSCELAHAYRNVFFTSFAYSLTENNITDVLLQDATKKVTIETVVNIRRLHYYSMNFIYLKKLNNIWTTSVSFLPFYGIYIGNVNDYSIHQGIPSFEFNTSNSFYLMEGLSMEAGFKYSHQSRVAFDLLKPTYNLSLGVQKSVFKKRGSLSINVSDLFWKAYRRGITSSGDVSETWSAKTDTRVIRINFTYNFGRTAEKTDRSTGADNEKERAN